MQLEIYSPREGEYLRKIEWNFDDLKEEIVSKTQDYMNLVYTDDQIKEARNDRAALNKLIKAMEDKRKEIKREVMVPYNGFEKQVKELTGIINEAVKGIDDQIKEYEKRKREEKLEIVQEIYRQCIGDLDRVIPFEKAFKESYLNAGTTQKSIRDEMKALYAKTDRELKIIIADMSPYVPSMKKVYEETLDFSKAMEKKHELEEAEKLRIQAEEERKSREAERPETPRPAPVNPPPPVIEDEPNIEPAIPESWAGRRKRITFRVTASEGQFDTLNRILQELSANCIRLEILAKEER